jgi:hypothetical protein
MGLNVLEQKEYVSSADLDQVTVVSHFFSIQDVATLSEQRVLVSSGPFPHLSPNNHSWNQMQTLRRGVDLWQVRMLR